MLYTDHDQGGFGRGDGRPRIEAAALGQQIHPSASTARSQWKAIAPWAQVLADEVALDQPAQNVAVFIHDPAARALRLVGQVFGAGEDTGEVTVLEWLVPLEGSVCGRVFRTGEAALCADVRLDPDHLSFPGVETRSSLTVPLRAAGATVGVVTVQAPWLSGFSIADYERLTDLASAAMARMPTALAE
jgi:GAF domain-containing protein